MAISGEILVVPFIGQGHLFPSIELCKHLSSRKFQATLIISSAISSSIPSSISHRHPLIQISEIPCYAAPPPSLSDRSGADQLTQSTCGQFKEHYDEMGQGIESLLSVRPNESHRPLCAVIDVMMSWSKDLFAKFGIPTVGFFTSGACSAAMEYAMWKARSDELKPGQTRLLPGLPEDLAVSYIDLERPPHHGGPPGGPPVFMKPGGGFRGPPGPGTEPMWLGEVKGTIALMMSTSRELEGLFLDYLGQQMEQPVWGVGPLLPEEYWNPTGSILHDRDMRPINKQSSHSEEDVIQWLDTKLRGSVLYVSFGSEVGPSEREYAELASALEDLDQAFIWVAKPGSCKPGPPPPGGKDEGYYLYELEAKAGKRGLIISGWAPQLLILSHSSTGGFLTHCGWNSTVEAIGQGVPMLAWPIRGDQFYNAKLVVSHLKIGHMVKERDVSKKVEKDDVVKGILKLMSDEGAKLRAVAIKEKYEGGFPATSHAALDAFVDFVVAMTG